MFRVKSLIYKQDVFQQKLLKEDNPRAKQPPWHLLQELPLNRHSAGFGTGLSLTLNLPPYVKKRAAELSSKSLDSTPSPGSICQGPSAKSLHLTSLRRKSNCDAGLLHHGLAALLCGSNATDTLCEVVEILTGMTGYSLMLKVQALKDSCAIMNHCLVLGMEMVSAFEYRLILNVFLTEGKIWQIF